MPYLPDANGVCQNVDKQGRLCGEVHNPRKCQGHTKDSAGRHPERAGKQCTNWPLQGQQVCKFHGGNNAASKAKAQQILDQREVAIRVAHLSERFGVPVDTSPVDALEQGLREAMGNVTVLRHLVAGLGLDVYGDTWHATGKPTGEAKPHVLVVMYAEERDRLHRIAKDCAALGLDQRRVQLEEAKLTGVMQAVNDGLSLLDAETRERVSAAIAASLRRLAEGPR